MAYCSPSRRAARERLARAARRTDSLPLPLSLFLSPFIPPSLARSLAPLLSPFPLNASLFSAAALTAA
eukprot:scaffold273608_cov30-Tisochrysis_lutea.AAC.1